MIAEKFKDFISPTHSRKSAFYLMAAWVVLALFILPITSLLSVKTENVWITCSFFILSFGIINAMIAVRSKVWIQYIMWSVLFYIFLAIFLVGYAGALSGFNWEEVLSHQVSYVAIFISYFLILGLSAAIRGIASILKFDQIDKGY